MNTKLFIIFSFLLLIACTKEKDDTESNILFDEEGYPVIDRDYFITFRYNDTLKIVSDTNQIAYRYLNYTDRNLHEIKIIATHNELLSNKMVNRLLLIIRDSVGLNKEIVYNIKTKKDGEAFKENYGVAFQFSDTLQKHFILSDYMHYLNDNLNRRDEGNLSITKITENSMEGYFSGRVAEINNYENTLHITKGKFRIPLHNMAIED